MTDMGSVDVRRETAVELSPDLTPSYPPEVMRLVEWDERLSSIAGDVTDLQGEFTRLRRESEAVVRLLGQREAELADKEISLSRLANDCASAQEGKTEAQASLFEAESLLEGSRERAASLERELDVLRARVTELEELEMPALHVPPEPAYHVRLVPLPSGYELSEMAEPPPRVGELVEVNGSRFSVTRIGRSPLPGNARPCAFLLPEPGDFTPLTAVMSHAR